MPTITNEYMGALGEELVTEVVAVNVVNLSVAGTKKPKLLQFQTDEGNTIIVFAKEHGVVKNRRYKIAGHITNHNERHGVKQTVLQGFKCEEVA